jgi:hypothetical protein
MIRASVGWHLLAGGAAVLVPGAAPWAIGGIVLNHALITAAGLTPRSSLLGPNMTRLPQVRWRSANAVTIDDGRTQVRRVLDLLDAHGQRSPLHRGPSARTPGARTRDRGAQPQHQTWRSIATTFSFLGPRAFCGRDLARSGCCRKSLASARHAPALRARNPFLGPVLHRLGAVAGELGAVVSTARRQCGHRARAPDRRLQAGDILLLHDGNAARTDAGRRRRTLPPLLARIPCRQPASRDLAEAFGGRVRSRRTTRGVGCMSAQLRLTERPASSLAFAAAGTRSGFASSNAA